MEYALVARPLRAKLNDLIGELPCLLVHEFLDIGSAMPPERLRWSRILKRPLMAHAEPDDNILGAVNIDEVLPHKDARVGGNCATSRSIVFIHRSVASLPEHLHDPDSTHLRSLLAQGVEITQVHKVYSYARPI